MKLSNGNITFEFTANEAQEITENTWANIKALLSEGVTVLTHPIKTLINLRSTSDDLHPRYTHVSCAQWPDAGYTAPDGTHISTADHFSEAAARAACALLEGEGFDGEGNLYPLNTWVEGFNDKGKK